MRIVLIAGGWSGLSPWTGTRAILWMVSSGLRAWCRVGLAAAPVFPAHLGANQADEGVAERHWRAA